MDTDLSARSKVFVATVGIGVLVYCVIVLGYVGTTPDVRLRGLLSDSPDELPVPGMVIRDVIDLDGEGPRPEPGDILQSLGDRPIRSFIDFSLAFQSLRSETVESAGRRVLRTDLADDAAGILPALCEADGQRFVKIEFYRQAVKETVVSRLTVQSLPFHEVLLSFVWLLLQFLIFAVSALAAWHRPFDGSARLFFAMCAVTMAAFIGGFHWWVISGSFLLNTPFVISALLLPAVSLHFFFSYPRLLLPMSRFRRQTVTLIYAVPAMAVMVILGLLVSARWFSGPDMSVDDIRRVQWCLFALRSCIYAYMMFAAVCFFVMLLALANEYFSTSSPTEQNQVKWMFRAGVFSAIPVCYTLYLALFHRVDFALGSARIPMFLASLSFMLAYSIGIARFKLMLVDQFVSKGMLYLAVSHGLTVVYGVSVALVAFFANDFNMPGAVPGRFQQVLSVGVLLTFLVVVLSWSRDRLQQTIDRRFYREKYQLDKALQRVNRSLDSLADRHSLGQRMLTSCREVLGARFAAIYLRESGRRTFQLLAVDGALGLPEQFEVENALIEALKAESLVAALPAPEAADASTLLRTLRRFRCELVVALESEDEVEGLVILGRRTNGSGYTAEDLTFLNTLGQFTTVAMRSVKMHQDFARLNDELQIKANKIDEQKRQIVMMQAELTGGANMRPAQNPEPAELQRDMIRGNSPAIREVLATVRKMAPTESTVLIQGASGTGKELLAQAIHQNSARSNGPMVRVHCAALSPSLLESELFGHVKGAFTGAHRDRVGRFEMANSGTLFLDEIGDISLETQIKLLRVLQTKSFEPVGGVRTVTVDVRLIAATHQNLQKLIADGRFREDLFYRLNVVNITLPTLKERTEDIFELALYFLKMTSQQAGKNITHIDADALDALLRHPWPGNIRELENVIERAVVLCESDHISLKELPQEITRPQPTVLGRRDTMPGGQPVNSLEPVITGPPSGVVAAVRNDARSIRDSAEADELRMLEHALRQCRGNKAEAARHLGLPRSTFYSKLKKAGLL